MKKLIIIRGPLGVGKSTIAQLLAKRLKATYISLDKIIDDNNLSTTDGIPLENFLTSNKIIVKLADETKNTLIIDGCFYFQEQIDDLNAKLNNNVQIFSLISSVEKCIERDSKRKIVYGKDSAKFVHMVTTKVKAGIEIDNTNQTPKETLDQIIKHL